MMTHSQWQTHPTTYQRNNKSESSSESILRIQLATVGSLSYEKKNPTNPFFVFREMSEKITTMIQTSMKQQTDVIKPDLQVNFAGNWRAFNVKLILGIYCGILDAVFSRPDSEGAQAIEKTSRPRADFDDGVDGLLRSSLVEQEDQSGWHLRTDWWNKKTSLVGT